MSLTPDLPAVPGLITADDLCEAVRRVLAWRLSKILSAVGIVDEYGKPDLPVLWTLPDLSMSNGDQLPAIVVATTGTAAVPETDENGWYDTLWNVAVTSYVRDVDYDATMRRVRRYTAACRAAVAGEPTLYGLARGSVWAGEGDFSALPSNVYRTLASGTVNFVVAIERATSVFAFNPPYWDAGEVYPGGGTYPPNPGYGTGTEAGGDDGPQVVEHDETVERIPFDHPAL